MEKHKESIGENCQNGILNAKTSGTPRPNVPALRFPEFKGEWKKMRLGDNCNIQMCKRIMAAQTNTEGGVPFYKIGTIGGKADAYISKDLFDEYKMKYSFPHKGEVMITCAGTVGKCIIYNLLCRARIFRLFNSPYFIALFGITHTLFIPVPCAYGSKVFGNEHFKQRLFFISFKAVVQI